MKLENENLESRELEKLSFLLDAIRQAASGETGKTEETESYPDGLIPEDHPENAEFPDMDESVQAIQRQLQALSESEHDRADLSVHRRKTSCSDNSRKSSLSRPVLIESDQSSFSAYFNQVASCGFRNLECSGQKPMEQKCTGYEISFCSETMIKHFPVEFYLTFYAAAQVYRLDLVICKNCRPERKLIISRLLQNLNNRIHTGTFAYHEKTGDIHLSAQYSFQDVFSSSALKSQMIKLAGSCHSCIASIVHIAREELSGAEIRSLADSILADLAICLPAGVPCGLEEKLSSISRLMDRPVPSHYHRILAWIISCLSSPPARSRIRKKEVAPRPIRN